MMDEPLTLPGERTSTPPEDGLALLSNASMRARRHPLVVLAVWVWTAAFGAAIAWPFSRLVAGAYGAHPRGDGPLFDPGALALYDFVSHARDASAALAGHGLVVLPVALVGGLLPLACVLVAVTYTPRDRRRLRVQQLLSRAAPALPAFFALLLVATLIEGVLVALAFGGGGALAHALAPSLGEARGDQIGLVVGALVLLVAALVGVTHDLARAAVVRFRVSALRGALLGWKTLRRRPASSFFSWAWRALAAAVPVIGASIAATRFGGRSGTALVSLFLIHQSVILARVALRASWLARAMRSVDATHRVVRVTPPEAT